MFWFLYGLAMLLGFTMGSPTEPGLSVQAGGNAPIATPADGGGNMPGGGVLGPGSGR